MLIVLVSPAEAPSVSDPSVSVPEADTPGERMPPLLTVTPPFTVPVPASAAPLATVTAEPAASEPVTLKVPALMVVAPV